MAEAKDRRLIALGSIEQIVYDALRRAGHSPADADEVSRRVAAAARDPLHPEERDMLAWAYGKLIYRSFNNLEDALMMDRIKNELTDPARTTGGRSQD